MHRKSTFSIAIWLVVFLGAAVSVNTIRRGLNNKSTQAMTNTARTLSGDVRIVVNVVRTLLLP